MNRGHCASLAQFWHRKASGGNMLKYRVKDESATSKVMGSQCQESGMLILILIRKQYDYSLNSLLNLLINIKCIGFYAQKTSSAMLYASKLIRWLQRKRYQYEVTFSLYMLTPTEKFIFSTFPLSFNCTIWRPICIFSSLPPMLFLQPRSHHLLPCLHCHSHRR